MDMGNRVTQMDVGFGRASVSVRANTRLTDLIRTKSDFGDDFASFLMQPWNCFARPHTGRVGGSKLLGNFA
jgi:hypothetical protein